MKKGLTYKSAGVDIDEGERLVERIKPLVRKTFRPEVMANIGSFNALFKLNLKGYKEPVLVSGTDGVGTKLKVAFMTGKHNTVGIDLVAMCVNDIITSGAEPLFFLDYFATGGLKSETASQIIKGIVKGCREAGCSLIGGETAEMPGFYRDGEYDLSGFAVGIVEKRKIIDGSSIKPGDVIIGIASKGLHSNGFSLVRKVFFKRKKMNVESYIPALRTTLGNELLRPTRIYVNAVKALKEKVAIKGMAHITGGGIPGNIPRMLPKGIRARILHSSWKIPKLFSLIQGSGNITDYEMRRTFNMGVGFAIVLAANSASEAISLLRKNKFKAYSIGVTEKGGGGVQYT
jgi:phosphoribosylformylglycinamidine cyclo-ligase